MSRASAKRLRYASPAFMPQPMRAMAERHCAQQPAAVPKPDAMTAQRKPRRDDEHTEQVVFFNRIRTLALNDPRYALAVSRTFAIPNGGGRSKRTAGRLKAEGVKPGVPDVALSMPSLTFHGLFIEMKSLTGQPSREQREFIAQSIQLGYCAAVARGAGEAFALWKAYVDGTL